MARGRLREKREQLKNAVQGTLSEHHRFLLSSQLHQLDFFDGQLAELDQEIANRLGITNGPDDPDLHRREDLDNEENAEVEISAQPPEGTVSLSTTPKPSKSLSSAQVIRILDEVTGINVRIGEIVVAEIGTTVDRFPTDAHIAGLRWPLS